MILSASAISTTIKKVSLTTAGIASLLALSTAGANAVTLTPTTIIDTSVSEAFEFSVNGTFSASDTIDLTVSGTVNTLGGEGTNEYTTNAAGIVTVPTADGDNIGTANARGAEGFSSGALLIAVQGFGVRQLFLSNIANGLGNGTNPPTTLSTGSVTLASIFGNDFTGTDSLLFVIEPNFSFRDAATTSAIISTVPSFSSVGNAFTLNGTISQAGATDVPEPFTIVGTLIGGTAALRMRKKLKANNN